MASSIERLTENSVISLLNSVTGVNFYNGDRQGDIAHYDAGNVGVLIVSAKTTGKELTPASGVYPLDVELKYQSKIHDHTMDEINDTFQAIRQQLYYDSSLGSRVTTTGLTCFGGTIEQGEEEVDDENKIFRKTINLKLWVTPRV